MDVFNRPRVTPLVRFIAENPFYSAPMEEFCEQAELNTPAFEKFLEQHVFIRLAQILVLTKEELSSLSGFKTTFMPKLEAALSKLSLGLGMSFPSPIEGETMLQACFVAGEIREKAGIGPTDFCVIPTIDEAVAPHISKLSQIQPITPRERLILQRQAHLSRPSYKYGYI